MTRGHFPKVYASNPLLLRAACENSASSVAVPAFPASSAINATATPLAHGSPRILQAGASPVRERGAGVFASERHAN